MLKDKTKCKTKIYIELNLFINSDDRSFESATRIYIKVSPHYAGRLVGLCGLYDNNAENDFTSRYGMQEARADTFGNSWKATMSCKDIDSKKIQNPCEVRPIIFYYFYIYFFIFPLCLL